MSHIERSDGFHIVLPSNVDSSSGRNTPSHYHTQLANTLNLDIPGDQWEVGLVEMTFINTIKTIDKGEKINMYEMGSAEMNSHSFPLDDYYQLIDFPDDKSQPNIQVIELKPQNGLKNIISHPDYSFTWHREKTRFSVTIHNPDVEFLIIGAYEAFVLGFCNSRHIAEKFYSNLDKTVKSYIIKRESVCPVMASQAPRLIQTMPPHEKDYLILNSEAVGKVRPFNMLVRYLSKSQKRLSSSVVVPEGYYQTAQKLTDEINKSLTTARENRFTFSFDENTNRVRLQRRAGANGGIVVLDPALVTVLGFGETNEFSGNDYEATYPPDLRRSIYSLYVYCDLCLETYVGDAIVPLLRTVSYNATGGYGQSITVLYDNPIYVPLNKHTIDSIEISINDDTGRAVPFVEGKTVLTLHFRKRTL